MDLMEAQPHPMRETPHVGIPSLMLLSLATLIGSVGNMFVIGAVAVEKVYNINQ